MLEAVGIDPERVVEVRAMGDRNLRVPDNPMNPANRRISILLPFTTPMHADDSPSPVLGTL